MAKESGDLGSFIKKEEMNEALLLQQDKWQYAKRGSKVYYVKDRCIFTADEVRKGLDRWVRAATGRKLD